MPPRARRRQLTCPAPRTTARAYRPGEGEAAKLPAVDPGRLRAAGLSLGDTTRVVNRLASPSHGVRTHVIGRTCDLGLPAAVAAVSRFATDSAHRSVDRERQLYASR